MRTGVVTAAVICLLSASALAAPPVSIPVPENPEALVYTSGRVLWTTHTRHGPVQIHQALTTGGPATVLATIQRTTPSAKHVTIGLAANANGYLLVARDGRQINTDPCGCDYFVSLGELVVQGDYDGAQRKLVGCKPPRPKFDAEETDLDVTAGRTGFAFAGALCGVTQPITTVAPDGTTREVPGPKLPREFYGFSYAEPRVAYTTATGRIRVIDTTNGSFIQHRPPNTVNSTGFFLEDDGTLVLGPSGYSGTPRSLYTWTPGAAKPVAIPGAMLAELGGAVDNGGRVFYEPLTPIDDELALALTRFDGGDARTVGAPSAGMPRKPLALEGDTAAFTNRSCTGATQVTVLDLADGSPAAGPNGCPVELIPGTVTFARTTGRGTVQVRCPNGCSAKLTLVLVYRPRQISDREFNRYVDKVFSSDAARGVLKLPPSPDAVEVPMKLVKPAVALLEKHRKGLKLFPSIDHGDVGVGPEIARPSPTVLARLG